MSNIITGNGLTKSYKVSKHNSLEVLKGVDISIPGGKISVIVVPAGRGRAHFFISSVDLTNPIRGVLKFWEVIFLH